MQNFFPHTGFDVSAPWCTCVLSVSSHTDVDPHFNFLNLLKCEGANKPEVICLQTWPEIGTTVESWQRTPKQITQTEQMCSVYSCMSPESASPCLQIHPPTSKLFLVAMTFSITINDNNWVHLHIIIFTYFMNHTFPLLFDIIKKITCIHCIFLCGEKEPFPSSLNWELNTVLLWSLSICSLVVDFFSCIIFAIKILIMFGLVLIFFFSPKLGTGLLLLFLL